MAGDVPMSAPTDDGEETSLENEETDNMIYSSQESFQKIVKKRAKLATVELEKAASAVEGAVDDEEVRFTGCQ